MSLLDGGALEGGSTQPGGNIDAVAVEQIVESVLSRTTGFRQSGIAIANATINRIADAPIAIHLETSIPRGYSIDGNVLAAPITQDLHLGYSIEANERGGANLATLFIPARTYRRGNVNPAVLNQGRSNYNIVYNYSHNDVSGHDEIALSVDRVSGNNRNANPFIDIEIWEINVSLQSTGGQTAAEVDTAITQALQNYLRTGTYNIDKATIESRITNLSNTKAEQSALEAKADSSDLNQKANKRPFDWEVDPYYYTLSRDARDFWLNLRNIDRSLLPNVNRLFVVIQGQTVYNAAFNPATDTLQTVKLEVSTTEAGNIVNNARGREFLRLQIYFRHDSTDVYRVEDHLVVTAS